MALFLWLSNSVVDYLSIILTVLMILLLKYEYPFGLATIISLQFYNKPFERFNK